MEIKLYWQINVEVPRREGIEKVENSIKGYKSSYGSTSFPKKDTQKYLPFKYVAARHGRWKPQEDESFVSWLRVKWMFQPKSETQLNAWN